MKMTEVRQPIAIQPRLQSAGQSTEVPIIESGAGALPSAPLVISTFGPEGAGKSRLIETAPGLGMIGLEHKSLPIAEAAARELGRTVIKPGEDLIRVGNPMLLATLPYACITPEKMTNVQGMKADDIERRAARLME